MANSQLINRDRYKGIKGAMAMGLGLKFEDSFKHALEGQVIVKLEHKNGTFEEYDLGKNIIVSTAGILISVLLKNTILDETAPTGGIFCLAVGTGDSGWNTSSPPTETDALAEENGYYLYGELSRKPFTSTHFVDELGAYTATATNIVDYVATFGLSEAVGPLVEMGLFGGDATSEPNTGLMVNYKTFPVIHKPNGSTMTLVWRITA